MGAPVDVLAVIRAACDADALPYEVHAAVAELIEANTEYDAAFDGARGLIEDAYESDSYGVPGSEFYRCKGCDAESGAGILNEGVTHEADCVVRRFDAAESRRVAALARVKGGAAVNRLGLESTDCTGVMTGNSDLDCCDQGWSNTPDTADGHAAPLPVYPQPSDLPSPSLLALRDVAALVVAGLLGYALGVFL